jgi:hypothetical protein
MEEKKSKRLFFLQLWPWAGKRPKKEMPSRNLNWGFALFLLVQLLFGAFFYFKEVPRNVSCSLPHIHGNITTPPEPQHFLTVILPERDRDEVLYFVTHYLQLVLQKQLGEGNFEIIAVHQNGDKLFNRGALFNVGIRESSKKTDYFVLHDVDLLAFPEVSFKYPDHAASQLCVSHLRSGEWITFYDTHAGGVMMVTREVLETVNGFSNDFWGWGAEDDEFSHRIRTRGFPIYRPPISRFVHWPGQFLKHSPPNPCYSANVDKLLFQEQLPTNFNLYAIPGLANLSYTVTATTELFGAKRLFVDLHVNCPCCPS